MTTCEQCGGDIKKPRTGQRFCSRQCSAANARGDRYAGRRTHCVSGHEYTEENTYVSKDGRKRHCRECKRIRQAGKPRKYVPAARRRAEQVRAELAAAPESTLWRPAGWSPEPQVFGSRSA